MKEDTEHKNMFSYHADKQAVYKKKFQSDQKADADRAGIYLCGIFICIGVYQFYHEMIVILLGCYVC